MKKGMFITLALLIILIFSACTADTQYALKGFYQSEKDINGYLV